MCLIGFMKQILLFPDGKAHFVMPANICSTVKIFFSPTLKEK